MFCRNCGANISDGAAFCGSCGSPQGKSNTGRSVYENKTVNEDLLFQSIGAPKKRKQWLMVSGIILIVAGGLLLVITLAYLYGKAKMTFSIFGIASILFGIMVLIVIKFDFTNKCEFKIYSGHVEGIQTFPRKQFSLSYQEILSVRKESLFGNDLLFLETRDTTYSALTNQVNEAYAIISHKLDNLERDVIDTVNGQNEERLKCRECGHPISKSAEVCPNCGAKTRYGDLVKKKEANKWELYIELILFGVGIFIVSSNLELGLALIVGAIVGLVCTLRKVNE